MSFLYKKYNNKLVLEILPTNEILEISWSLSSGIDKIEIIYKFGSILRKFFYIDNNKMEREDHLYQLRKYELKKILRKNKIICKDIVLLDLLNKMNCKVNLIDIKEIEEDLEYLPLDLIKLII